MFSRDDSSFLRLPDHRIEALIDDRLLSVLIPTTNLFDALGVRDDVLKAFWTELFFPTAAVDQLGSA